MRHLAAILLLALLGSAACSVDAPGSRCTYNEDCPEGYACDLRLRTCFAVPPDAAVRLDAGLGDQERPDAAIPDTRDAAIADLAPDFDLARPDLGAPDTSARALLIEAVVLPAQIVAPSQGGYEVHVALRNDTGRPLSLQELTLRFERGEEDLGGWFQVAPAGDPGAQIFSGQSSRIFRVEVSAAASAGTVVVDARVSARDPEGTTWSQAGASSPGRWMVQPEGALVVSTSEDQDDTDDSPTLEAAGGAFDLSLREALLVANAGPGVQAVLFDPTSFPPGQPAAVTLDPERGNLPPILRQGLRLDASGAGVSLEGARLDQGRGLLVQAHDVTLRGLTLRGFGGRNSYGLRIEQVTRATVERCRFLANGWSEGSGTAQVRVRGGGDHVLRDCQVLDGDRDGVILEANTRAVQLLDSQIVGNRLRGLVLNGSELLVQGCSVTGNGVRGVELARARQSALRDCQIGDNGFDRADPFKGWTDRNGVNAVDLSEVVRIEGCALRRNAGHAVAVSRDSTRVEVTQCRFEGNGGQAIFLQQGANQLVEPPGLGAHDGIRLHGTAGLGAGTVEVYAYAAQLTSLGTAEVGQGAWAFEVAAAQPVTATFTTLEGSTSAMARDPRDEALVVSTLVDELDGGDNILLVAQAGGEDDLSLREALTLANNRIGPDTITFTVFPVDNGPAVFALSSGEPLPPLLDEGTVLDSSGQQLELRGGERGFASGSALLELQGSGSAVLGLSLRGFAAPGGALIRISGGEGSRVEGCTLTCDQQSLPGIEVRSGASQAWLQDNSVNDCSLGVLIDQAAGVMVLDNQLLGSSSAGVQIDKGREVQLRDNIVAAGFETGVRVRSGGTTVRLVGNQIFHNAGPAIEASYYVDSLRSFDVLHNSLVANLDGLNLNGVVDLLFANNLVVANSRAGLYHKGSSWVASHNLYFGNGEVVVTPGAPPDDPLLQTPGLTDVSGADPELEDVAGGDLTPRAAAIDRGMDLGEDRNGDAPDLYNGAAPDIGAIETSP